MHRGYKRRRFISEDIGDRPGGYENLSQWSQVCDLRTPTMKTVWVAVNLSTAEFLERSVYIKTARDSLVHPPCLEFTRWIGLSPMEVVKQLNGSTFPTRDHSILHWPPTVPSWDLNLPFAFPKLPPGGSAVLSENPPQLKVSGSRWQSPDECSDHNDPFPFAS